MLKKLIIGTVLSLMLVTNAFGATMNTNTYYVNPQTGKTDDGGTANIELGEGMCRSAVYKTAEVEETDKGAVITMRMLLYSNLKNIRLAVQDSPKGEYRDIKYSVVKESASEDSADLKFTVPSAESLVRVNMYVAPMSRDVCFYFNCDKSTVVQEIKEGKTEERQELFSDISSHWAKADIIRVVEKGLFSGTGETTFSPEGEMTRGMFVTVLGRLSGEKIEGTCDFKDVDNSMYYAPYIGWASRKGIVKGVSETSFNPNAPVTCEQAALIIKKYADYRGVEFKTRGISPTLTGVSPWASEAVTEAARAGIISKQNTNGYNYKSAATRADVASMLSAYTNYYEK